MIDSHFRTFYQSLLVDPLIVRRPEIKKIPPHFLTLFGCFLGILVLPLLAYGMTSLALFCILLSGYLDTLDGTIARISHRASPLGAVLDIFCDRIVEFSIILGLYFADPESRGTLSLFMLGSVLMCVTSFLAVGIFVKNKSNKSFHYSPGLIERGEAFSFFILMVLFPSFFPALSLTFSAFVFLSSLIRIYEFSLNN